MPDIIQIMASLMKPSYSVTI